MDEITARGVSLWGKVANLGAKHAATVHVDAILAENLRFAAGPELLLSAGCHGVVVEPVSPTLNHHQHNCIMMPLFAVGQRPA